MTAVGETRPGTEPPAAGALAGTGGGRPRPGLIAAGLLIVLLLVATAWPGLLSRHPADGTNLGEALRGPSWAHWFGTDQLGRDVFARVVTGARHSLLLGAGATALGAGIGATVGLAAALGGRFADGLLMRLVDLLLAFPELLLALLVITIVGPGSVNAAVAIGIAAVPSYARVVRSRALVVRHAGFVDAGVALGLPRPVIMLRHIVPNTLGPLLVLATVGIGTAIISGSALSFLGLGTKPPAPEWGAMLADGRGVIDTAWWVVVFPGAAIAATVVAVTVLGRHARLRVEGRTP
ncbi:ABC-type dipeptide/oligopeptide/nickel transport system, permease component [Frankia casuarinae]|uniref:Binding-protein-dependent transport systems inner membrane component n=1 Tax=Frankia casuarinae (strain DSM 45818 / CECT 9043 / HFP020203 / CcI3) TaxID=106370 RepID=Q2J9B7_FRACC|nr:MULTISPECIES: ABC transporter permease [Frankia]ABD12125.1 binding-protein-dependent transport systems inner membrane component [Frankia casuarinae]EYT91831.1 ABC-type dipeptide/oligopeptide/nickel transport system, permease component [Frankia casuarinae]KDA40639.1 ABC-type dipeptide/oligopeptide/nickel transport system, permease component [Frankia sp. BMG5.23]KEZ34823.1 ABC-type dipeptide/oligopeptide/nickel transport system, permease component [Frankia sp. CeD]ORT51571.1 peptide ABC trans